MKSVSMYLVKAGLILCGICVLGCTINLAPQYDAALFKGITTTNVKIMELFASVSAGTERGTCGERKASYNAVIGAVDALTLQLQARPMPESSVTEKVNEYLAKRGQGPLIDKVAPSAAALESIAKQLARMQTVDCSSGLAEAGVAVFKNAVIISMDQALTYEAFLER